MQKNFDYLNNLSGDISVIFYGATDFDTVDSVDFYILDPKYYD